MKQVFSFLRSNAVGLALIVLGRAGGSLYYRLTLCQSGACPLTSTPYYSMFVGGLGMMIPGTASDIAGFVLVVGIVLYQRYSARRTAAA